MKPFLGFVPFMLASLAALGSVEKQPSIDSDPLQVHRLASAPIAHVSEAKTHFDGRHVPAGAVATHGTGVMACSRQGERFMDRGPLRRAVRWLFRGRRRC